MIELQATCQTLKTCCHDMLVSDSLNAIKMRFVFSDEWDGLTKTAQFTQKNNETGVYVTYNVLLDEDETAMLPNEIESGVVLVSVFGVDNIERMTTNTVAFPVMKSGFVGDGQTPIPPTPDLYQQLLMKVLNTAGSPVIGENGNWYLDNIDTGVKADWSAEQENAAASAEAAADSETAAKESAEQAEAARKAIQENQAALVEQVEKNTADLLTKAHVVVDTMQGAVCATDVASDAPLRGLRVYGKTTQEGTPSPAAPVPMVNVGAGGYIGVFARGKNLIGFIPGTAEDSNGVSGIVNADGSLTFTGTADGTYWGVGNTESVRLLPGDYVLSTTDAVNVNVNIGNDTAGTFFLHCTGTENKAFTLNAPMTCHIYCSVPDGATVDTTFYFSLTGGKTATAYEPYKDGGSVTLSTPNGLSGVPVTTGGNYTDANGQMWLCDEIDLNKGVYIQRCVKQIITGGGTDHSFGRIYVAMAEKYKIQTPGLCNVGIYKDLSSEQGYYFNNGSMGFYFAYNEVFTSAEAFNSYAASTPIECIVVLAQPVEIPLTADELAAYRAMRTYKPNTTAYNDAGAWQQVDYTADTKEYIDNKIAAIAAAIVNG